MLNSEVKKTELEAICERYELATSTVNIGVYDWNTTWAFIAANLRKLRSYDGKINRGKFYRKNGGYHDVVSCCKKNKIDFKFIN